MNNITTLWQNPHLRYAVILVAALQVAGIWLPQYKPQLDGTVRIVLFYAIAAAANSTPAAPANSSSPTNKPGSSEPPKGQ